MTRLRLIFLLLSSPMAAGAAWPATLVVPDQYSTVQSAIVAAAGGDSIFVRSGTYAESLILAGKDVSIIGETDATVLTSGARILELGAGVTSATVLERLTFQSGRSTTGAAIYVRDGASVTIRTSRFLNNITHVEVGSTYGGAMRIDPLCAATLDSCLFASNTAAGEYGFGFNYGGAVSVAADGALTATWCRFERNTATGFEGGAGGAMVVDNNAQVRLLDCEFVDNRAGYGGAISASGGLSVERCRFEGNRGTYGPAAISGSAIRVVNSLFIHNESNTVAVWVYGPSEFRGNTVADNGTVDPFYQTGGVEFGDQCVFDHNIVVRNRGTGVNFWSDAVDVLCNDVWSNGSNGASNYSGALGDPTGFDGNISENPLFCGATGQVYNLRPDSPCAPSGSCGLIGALDANCVTADVPALPAGRDLRLLAPRPNPATIPMRFAFEIVRPVVVRLEVLDLAGRRVATPEQRFYDAGRHEVLWQGLTNDGRRLSPGVYVVRLSAGAEHDARTFVLTR